MGTARERDPLTVSVLDERVGHSSEEVSDERVGQSSEEVRAGHSSEGRESWTVK